MAINEISLSWERQIMNHVKDDNFRSRTCKIYNRQAGQSDNHSDNVCPCGRLVRRHSFDGESIQEKEKHNNPNWEPPGDYRVLAHSANASVNVFGTLKSNDCKFLRIDIKTKEEVIYNLLVDDCGGIKAKPSLILSVYGGAKYFTMTERLEKETIRGIIDAATATDAWILTAGINNGVSKLVGEGISHYCLLTEYSNKVKCIGLTMWGTVNESTRIELKDIAENYPRELLHRQIPDNVQDKETIEKTHTHCILYDSGYLNEYLGDSHRHRLVKHACTQQNHTCYAVTIIVEGGINTLEVIENDIEEQRPILFIQGSGRLADVLATLIEQTSNDEKNHQQTLTEQEISKAIEQFFSNSKSLNIPFITRQIQRILNPQHRHLLNVFSLDRDNNVAETIFKAIFNAQNNKNKINKSNNTENEEQQRQNEEDKLVDLAVDWNYIDGVLSILKSRKDLQIKKNERLIQESIEREKELFKKCLEKNRPAFIEYFLAAGFDPLTLIEKQDLSDSQTLIINLYKNSYSYMTPSHSKRVATLFGNPYIKRIEKLDKKLNKFVGSFIGPIYSEEDDKRSKRICIDMRNHVCTCCSFRKDDSKQPYDQNIAPSNSNNQNNESDKINNSKYTAEQIIRDLFLWSVFMDMPEMAKIFLVHLQCRICAALIASAIFKRYSEASITVYLREKFQNQALEFEEYAAKFIDKCYEYNERVACELLLRQIALFGNVTCMQVAISGTSGKLLGTHCFDQTLTQVWYNKLSITNRQAYAKPLQLLSIFSFGFLAPVLITYREEETRTTDQLLSFEGINYYMDRKLSKSSLREKFWFKFKYFHQSPVIKMWYHSISYIWFLLVFSYMMLYHFDSPSTFTIPHWTEIYVIITVSTMLCEEVRKLYHEYRTRMVERWNGTGSSLLTVLTNIFYITPYFLFYVGLGFRYRAYNDDILTTARIMWAFDLEMWYLRSLKFIIALKSIGPKLFMLKNMFRDLVGFVYMIFIAIAAYGVISRALILYKQVPFNAGAILREIFYEPYWFIYGEFSDKDLLDEKINNDTSSVVAEATAIQVLLAFHMLFINILILNLLIAVFTHTIDKVQENTEFYWRHQRYAFVREYFERPPLAYPPLIIVPHIILLFCAVIRICCPIFRQNKVTDNGHTLRSKIMPSVFKIIPKGKSQLNIRWNEFESAATHNYARAISVRNKMIGIFKSDDIYSKKTMNTIDSDVVTSSNEQQQTITNLKEDITQLKSVLTNIQKHIEENNSSTEILSNQEKIKETLQWMMNAIVRSKMNDPKESLPNLDLSAAKHDTPL